MQEVTLPDHHPVTLTLHSRGEGLQINEMVFQKQATPKFHRSFRSNHACGLPRVNVCRQLLGDATQAFVMNENGTSHGIQMQAIERVFTLKSIQLQRRQRFDLVFMMALK